MQRVDIPTPTKLFRSHEFSKAEAIVLSLIRLSDIFGVPLTEQQFRGYVEVLESTNQRVLELGFNHLERHGDKSALPTPQMVRRVGLDALKGQQVATHGRLIRFEDIPRHVPPEAGKAME